MTAAAHQDQELQDQAHQDRERQEQAHQEQAHQERRRQMRGLLWLGGAAAGVLLFRAARLGVFHTGWWRF